jgi:integrase
MAKPTRFKPKQTTSGWRLNIPPKFSETGKRQQLFYRTKELAETAAASLRKDRDNFGHQAVAIAPSIADQAVAALRLLEPLGIGLLDAVSRFVETETRQRASVPVTAAITAFRAAGDDSWSRSQSTAYRLRGEKLVEAFGERLISTITGEELQSHLTETTGGHGAFNQSLRLVRAIWNWSAKPPRKWCAVEVIQHLESKAVISDEIGVLTPKQAQGVLDAAATHFPEAVPALAIQLFTGLRKAELERLTPADFNDEGISVPAISAKTKRRRFIQMPEPLAAWLKAYPIIDYVCPPDWQRKQVAVRRLAGFRVWSPLVSRLKIEPPLDATPPADLPEWPDNALRHTAATVALALGKPLEQLVFEHGHTGGLEMLRKHYIGAMPKKDAIAIWSLRPRIKQSKKSNLRIA